MFCGLFPALMFSPTKNQMEPPASQYEDSIVENVPIDETSLIDRFPYASRLCSNNVPSDMEMEEIKAFLQEPTEQAQQMEAEISSLQARLNRVQAKHTALKNQVDTCRSLITIPRRLPADILLEIFFHCLPDARNPMMDSRTAPLLLTAVCQRWRILALQTPKLWSTIHIPIEDMQNQWLREERLNVLRENTHLSLYPLLADWFSRSGIRPLTFSFFLDGDNDAIKTIFANYLQILLPFVSRWKSVFFEGSVQTFKSTLSSIHSSRLESLESLFLKLDEGDFPEDMPIFDAPCLRKVSIEKVALEPTELALPWRRLTHLDLGVGYRPYAPSITQLSNVLSICTSLIYLGVDIEFGPTVQPMHFPKLQRISIRQRVHSNDSTVSRAFCEKIKAPSLQQISLRGFNADGFLALLSANGRHVQSLNTDARYINIATLADGLRHCPSLRSFSITRLFAFRNALSIDDTFFPLFVGRGSGNDSDSYCPLLQELIFEDIVCETLAGLVSFLEVKQNSDPRVLSRLAVLVPCSILEDGQIMEEVEIYRALKPFTDAGLRLQMFDSISEQTQYPICWPYSSSPIQYADCWRD